MELIDLLQQHGSLFGSMSVFIVVLCWALKYLFNHMNKKFETIEEHCNHCKANVSNRIDTIVSDKSKLEREIINQFNEIKILLSEKYVTKQEVESHIVQLRNDIQKMSGDTDRQLNALEVAVKELTGHLFYNIGKQDTKNFPRPPYTN